jgi:site-specific recombinase XerD
MTSVTPETGNRHTTRRYQRESPALESARQNRYTDLLHTASAERSHTFVTTMLDAGVDLRDVQIAARHADPRTTMRYDRARKNPDRHPNYILAAYMASGT